MECTRINVWNWSCRTSYCIIVRANFKAMYRLRYNIKYYKRLDCRWLYFEGVLAIGRQAEGINLHKLLFVRINTMKLKIEASHHSSLHYYHASTLCYSNHYKSCVSDGLFWFMKILKLEKIVWLSGSSLSLVLPKSNLHNSTIGLWEILLCKQNQLKWWNLASLMESNV